MLFRLRLGFLVAAIVMVAGFTILSVQNTWRHIHELEAKLTSSNLESFRLADDFQQRLQKLNNTMMRYVVGRDPKLWTDFELASTNLDHWLDQYDTRLNKNSTLATDREREVFKQLNDAYDGYIAAGIQVHTNQQPASAATQGFVQLGEFEHQADLLQQLGVQLADAHRAAQIAFLGDANLSLSNLRVFLLGGVALMLILVAVLGVILYRDQIAPLRTKLVHSQLILENQEKLATLGTLAAGIAHEIRNPLTSVKARLYTLEKHIETPSLARKDIEIIGTEITRLERIVQEILKFARPAEPAFEMIGVQTLLGEVYSLMAASLECQRAKFVLEPGPNLFVSADPAHLKQVLINLIRNATEAVDEKGGIWLRVRARQAHLNGATCEVAVLEIADTGCGIPPEAEKRLFDPFFSTKATGTGLGLSIAARIIEKHGGVLQYQTCVGRGTTFGIVLKQVLPRPITPVTRGPHTLA